MYMKEAISKFSQWRQLQVKEGTVASYERILRQFCLRLYATHPQVHIEDIELEDVTKYLNDMNELGWQRNSFVTITTALQKFFWYYGKQGYPVLNYELIPVVAAEETDPRVCTPEEYQALIQVKASNNDPRHVRNTAIISLFWHTGMRNSELCSLDVDDLADLKAKVRTAKARKHPYRTVFWKEEAERYLQLWEARRAKLETCRPFHDPSALFVSIGNQKHGQRLTIKGIGEMLRQRSKRAGLDRIINAHSFRHAYGHRMANKQLNNSSISKLLGHTSLTSSYRYTQLSDPDLEDLYRQ